MANLDLEKLDLNEAERKAVAEILKEVSENGISTKMNDILLEDYSEIPVSIDTFLHDTRYLGRGLTTGEGKFTLFPYWENLLKRLYPDPLKPAICNTLALTGCLTGDTKVPLLNGKTLTMKELSEIGNLDEYVYSYDVEKNLYQPGHLIKAFSTGIKDVYEITLDNGKSFRATSNHQFMVRDKSWKSIDSGLSIGDSLMPLNRKYDTELTKGKGRTGYESILNPNKDGTYTELFTHRIIMRWKRGSYKGVIHHKDFNKLNNDPRNLLLTNWSAHRHYHAKRGGEYFKEFNEKRKNGTLDPDTLNRVLAGGLKGCLSRWSKKESHEEASIRCTKQMLNGKAKYMADRAWSGENREKNLKRVSKQINSLNTNKEKINEWQIRKGIKVANLCLIENNDLNEELYNQTKLNHNMRTGYPKWDNLMKRISYDELYNCAKNYNHKIVSIKYIGKEEVYDLTVEKYHNFALDCGIVAHNSIGIGKSTEAVIIGLYELYRMMCLKDPAVYYGIMSTDTISFAVINITLEASHGVAWDKLQNLIQSSEWFMARGRMAGQNNPEWVPDTKYKIDLICGSQPRHFIGKALFWCFMDEISFQPNQSVERQKEKATELVSSATARMQSRFMNKRGNPTILVMASSKRTEQSFLETWIENKKKNESKTTIIVDEPQWVVRDDKKSDKTFKVAIGNKFLPSEVLPPDVSEDECVYYRERGFRLIDVPINYYENFIDDIDIALTDIAGISTTSTSSYISGERITQCKTESIHNPFTKDIIEVGDGLDDNAQIWDWFDLSKVDPAMKKKPLYMHLDLSLSGDKSGIGGTWIKGLKISGEGDNKAKELYYQLAFIVSIKAPRGHQVSFEKIRNFIYWLKQQGFNIKGISSDTFARSGVEQDLLAKGYHYEILSVDRVGTDRVQEQYAYLKNCLYEKRILLPRHGINLLTEELVGLERNNNSGKIDHSPSSINCFTGDTKVSLLDGRELSFIELVKEYEEGKENWVYTVNENTLYIEPKLIKKAWCSGHNAKLLEITLDNGEKIRCTPEHRFMLRNGSYVQANELLENDSLMPLYRKYPNKGVLNDYRLYYEVIEDQWHFEHRKFATEVFDEKHLVHHKNCNKKDNSPTNLIWMSKKAHVQVHAELQTGAQSPEAKAKRSKSLKQNFMDTRNNKEYWIRWYPGCTAEEAYEKHLEYEKNIEMRKELHDKRKENNRLKTEAQRKKQLEMFEYYGIDESSLKGTDLQKLMIKYAHDIDPTYQQKVTAAVSNNHKLGKYVNANIALQKCNQHNKMLRELFPIVDKDEFFEFFNIVYDEIPSKNRAPWVNRYRQKKYELVNHKVVSIKELDTTEDVYDIEVDGNHNFALSAGVFVHNSKDSADAFCGSVWMASKNGEQFAYDFGESLDTITDFNNEASIDDYNKDFESSLLQLKQPTTNTQGSGIDFGMGPAVDYMGGINDGIIFW